MTTADSQRASEDITDVGEKQARHIYCHIRFDRCLQQGRYEKATVVDHITPHKGNQQLFWDRNNWQPLCKQCHDRKTATEDGGFGR